jgi:uncharacterized protein YbaP (TraB family)
MRKKYSFLLLLSFSVLFPSLLLANDQSIFWEITSPKGEVHYLFGTMHSDDNRISNFSKEVVNALKLSDLFISEVTEDLNTQGQNLKNTVYQKFLNRKELDQINHLADFYTMNEEYVFKIKPWLLALIFNSPRPITPFNQDNLLKSMARDLGMKVTGLETSNEHFRVLDSFLVKDQIGILRKVLNLSMKQKEVNYEYLMTAYLSFDPKKILKADEEVTKIIMSQNLWTNLKVKLLINRNDLFMDRILKFSKKEKLFVAVGASHLAGKNGLLSQFRKKGYKLNPLKPLN